jgi:dienelactone hydrolase
MLTAIATVVLPFFTPPSEGPAPELLALFDYDRSAPLAIEEVSSQALGDVRQTDLSYASPAGGRVPAHVYEPAAGEEGPYAGIVLMHGMPGSRSDMTQFAHRYVRAGAVVIAISAPFARPDGPRENVITFTAQDRAEQIQLIQDLRRAVDFLHELPHVDRERIGYVGGSYGGAVGGLLAGVEHRISAFALMVGDGGLVAHETDDEGKGPKHLSAEAFAAWTALMEPIEPIAFVRYASPSKLLFQNGRTDPFVSPADAEAYQTAASDPKTVIWYETGHAITGEMLEDQRVWLEEHLGLGGAR